MVDKVLEQQYTDELEQAYDTSSPEQVNKAKKKEARKRADRLKFVEAAMTMPEGRAWFYDLLEFCKVFRTQYVSGDPHATSFNCGQHNIGLKILDDIQTIASDNYIKMIKENK